MQNIKFKMYLIVAVGKLETWLKAEGVLKFTANQRLSPTSNMQLIKMEAKRMSAFGSTGFSTE